MGDMSVESQVKESMLDAVFAIVAVSVAYRLTGNDLEMRWFVRIMGVGLCLRVWQPFLGAFSSCLGAMLAVWALRKPCKSPVE